MSDNLLRNGAFSEGWATDAVTGNQTPNGWTLYIYPKGEDLVEIEPRGAGDTHRTVQVIPECVHKLNSQLPANEQLGGKDALILEGEAVYKIFHEGGAFGAVLLQIVDGLTPGKRIECVANVNASSYNNAAPGAAYWRFCANGSCSHWMTYKSDFGNKAWMAYTISTTVPVSGEVVYSLEFESHTVGNEDFFIDALSIQYIDGEPVPPDPEPTECKGLPRVDYERTYNVIHESADLDAVMDIVEAVYPQRQTVGFSTDDAGIGDLSIKNAVLWQWPNGERQVMLDWYATYYPGTAVTFKSLGNTPPVDPPVDPPTDPDWQPTRYIPRGTVGGFHGAQGDMGQINIARDLRAAGVDMPTAKLVVDVGAAAELKALHPNIMIVGRIIDTPEDGNLEWFRADFDPITQAQNRMNALRGKMLQYPDVDYWEIINEQNQANAENHRKRCQFFIEAMRIAETWGTRLACLSDSVGTPDYPYWETIANSGLFERMAQGGHALSLHEYGRVGQWDVVGRFTYPYENYILPAQLNIPLFITEYGVERQDTHDPALVWSQFVDYERLCALYPYFAGIHAYIGPNGDPDYLNAYSRIQDDFTQYAIDNKGRVNG